MRAEVMMVEGWMELPVGIVVEVRVVESQLWEVEREELVL